MEIYSYSPDQINQVLGQFQEVNGDGGCYMELIRYIRNIIGLINSASSIVDDSVKLNFQETVFKLVSELPQTQSKEALDHAYNQINSVIPWFQNAS